MKPAFNWNLYQFYAYRNEATPAVQWLGHATSPPMDHCHDRTMADRALREGQTAVVVTAGGNGTRLGFEKPKGMYPIGPKGESLFQLHFEKVVALTGRYGCSIPYCVMVSDKTQEKTVTFLRENDFFGLLCEDVYIFKQDSIPVLTLNGTPFLDEKGTCATSPDGHGGLLAAITNHENGCVLDQLQDRGIRYLFYHQIDLPFVEIGSRELLGSHIESGADMTCLVLHKQSPTDPMGTFFVDGETQRAHCIEYSEIPAQEAAVTNPDGSLKFWAGNAGVQVYSLDFLKRSRDIELPLHPVLKNQHWQFERFLFDLMPYAVVTFVESNSPLDRMVLKRKEHIPCIISQW